MLEIRSEFEATVSEIMFDSGAHVIAGETLLSLDCMKMLIAIQAPCQGYVYYDVTTGAYVSEGMLLARIE